MDSEKAENCLVSIHKSLMNDGSGACRVSTLERWKDC